MILTNHPWTATLCCPSDASHPRHHIYANDGVFDPYAAPLSCRPNQRPVNGYGADDDASKVTLSVTEILSDHHGGSETHYDTSVLCSSLANPKAYLFTAETTLGAVAAPASPPLPTTGKPALPRSMEADPLRMAFGPLGAPTTPSPLGSVGGATAKSPGFGAWCTTNPPLPTKLPPRPRKLV